MNLFEKVLQVYIEGLLKKGVRIAEIRGAMIGLEVLRGFREITLAYFYAFLECMVLTASIFSALFYNLASLSKGALPGFDLLNAAFLAVGLVSLFLLLIHLREKNWITAFGIQDYLSKLSLSQESQNSASKLTSTESETLRQLIDQQIEEKLKFQTSPPSSHLRTIRETESVGTNVTDLSVNRMEPTIIELKKR